MAYKIKYSDNGNTKYWSGMSWRDSADQGKLYLSETVAKETLKDLKSAYKKHKTKISVIDVK